MTPRERSAEYACRSLNVELWFDEDNEFSVRRAKAICKVCPALNACRQEALSETRKLAAMGQAAQDEGIFGGLTAGERRSLVIGRHSTVGQMDDKERSRE